MKKNKTRHQNFWKAFLSLSGWYQSDSSFFTVTLSAKYYVINFMFDV